MCRALCKCVLRFRVQISKKPQTVFATYQQRKLPQVSNEIVSLVWVGHSRKVVNHVLTGNSHLLDLPLSGVTLLWVSIHDVNAEPLSRHLNPVPFPNPRRSTFNDFIFTSFLRPE